MTATKPMPMFKHAIVPSRLVPVTLDGRTVELPDGALLAAALLAQGVAVFTTSPLRGEPRAPLCLMGSCFQCQVTIDGAPTRSCRARVRAGMRIDRSLDATPPSAREISRD